MGKAYQFPWQVKGEFLGHEYMVYDKNGNIVAIVCKAWPTWGGCYEIEILREDLVLPALITVLCIDAAVDTNN